MTGPALNKRLSVLLVTGLCAVLAACGSSAPKKPAAQVVDGATITAAGTKLAFGQSATVVSTLKTGEASPLTITVKSVKMGAAADLTRFGVPAMQPAVTPYYVSLDVKNVGTIDLGGSPIPVYLQDAKDVLINYSPLNGSFDMCPSQPLPKAFAAGATVSACLIYLLPQGDPATLVSYRPLQTAEPITWTGTIDGQAAPSPSPSNH